MRRFMSAIPSSASDFYRFSKPTTQQTPPMAPSQQVGSQSREQSRRASPWTRDLSPSQHETQEQTLRNESTNLKTAPGAGPSVKRHVADDVGQSPHHAEF